VFFCNFNILFLKIILGIIFLLFIPGYNLINILFPEFSIKVRLGLCSIFSLGLEILIMLIYYIVGVSLTNSNPFFFDINKQNKLYEFFVLLILICLTGSISIFALSSITIGFIVYELQKFIYLLIFFNVFLMKENYFVDLRKKKFKYFFMLIFIMIIGGLNISFRKLKFG